MVTAKITASSCGSGTSNYTAYTSIIHLGGGYRARIAFDMSKIPAGAKISRVELHMWHASSTYRASQTVEFKASDQTNWEYTYTGRTEETSVQVSGNHYKWDISWIKDNMLAHGKKCNLHLSTNDSTDRPYDGTTSNVYIEVVYEDASENLYRYNGASYEPMELYRYGGTGWEKSTIHRNDGSVWK